MKKFLIYITVPNKEEAKDIGKALVEEKLAAGVNIVDNITSFYWWDGKVNENGELVLFVQTKESLVDSLIERVKELHSHECPCVVSLPIEKGNVDFLNWIEKETK